MYMIYVLELRIVGPRKISDTTGFADACTPLGSLHDQDPRFHVLVAHRIALQYM
jgi:hypothetical protein